MLRRDNIKLTVLAVAALLIGLSAPAVGHGVHARFAHNADKVDGKHAVGGGASIAARKKKLIATKRNGYLPNNIVKKARDADKLDGLNSSGFLRSRSITTTHGGEGWLEHAYGASDVARFASEVRVSGDGDMVYPLNGPGRFGPKGYGLAKIDLCYRGADGGFITQVVIWNSRPGGPTLLRVDRTDRKSTDYSCDAITVNKPVPYGAGLYVSLDGDGFVHLGAVRATWTKAAAAQ